MIYTDPTGHFSLKKAFKSVHKAFDKAGHWVDDHKKQILITTAVIAAVAVGAYYLAPEAMVASSSTVMYADAGMTMTDAGWITVTATKTATVGGGFTISGPVAATAIAAAGTYAVASAAGAFGRGGGSSGSDDNPTKQSLIETIRVTSTANNYLTAASFGLLFLNPAAGAVALATTGIAGLGMGVAEGLLANDTGKLIRSAAEFGLGSGAGRLALRVSGLESVKFNWGAMRYYSEATGRFVESVHGRLAQLSEKAAEASMSLPFWVTDMTGK